MGGCGGCWMDGWVIYCMDECGGVKSNQKILVGNWPN